MPERLNLYFTARSSRSSNIRELYTRGGILTCDNLFGRPDRALALRIEVAGQNLSTPGKSAASAHLLSILAPAID